MVETGLFVQLRLELKKIELEFKKGQFFEWNQASSK